MSTEEPTSTPAPPAPKWGDPISEERQAELQGFLDAWNAPGADHGERKGPFDRTRLSDEEQRRLPLTAAEVFWLAERVRPYELGPLLDLHLEGAYLFGASLEGAYLLGVWVDSKTVLNNAVIDDQTQLGDIQWGGVGVVNLTRLDWGKVPRLGDETSREVGAKAEDYEAAVRAYRQVAAQLRA